MMSSRELKRDNYLLTTEEEWKEILKYHNRPYREIPKLAGKFVANPKIRKEDEREIDLTKLKPLKELKKKWIDDILNP